MQEFMEEAISLARAAATIGEVPVGAVVVYEGKIIGRGYNQRERDQCVLRHAELIAIEEASAALGAWRLNKATLYVTLEPCLMCAGALYQARIARLVYGAHDPKAGATGSLYTIHTDSRLNHRFPVEGGFLGEECGQLLKEFFTARRGKRPPPALLP